MFCRLKGVFHPSLARMGAVRLTHNPKTRDPKTRDPKTRDPETRDLMEARAREARVREARVREARVRGVKVRHIRQTTSGRLKGVFHPSLARMSQGRVPSLS